MRGMRALTFGSLIALGLAAFLFPALGQRQLAGEIEIRQSLQKLNTIGSVMMIAAMASPLVILPLGPVAEIALGSRLFSATTRWTAGDRVSFDTWAEPVLAGAAAGAGSTDGAAGRGVRTTTGEFSGGASRPF